MHVRRTVRPVPALAGVLLAAALALTGCGAGGDSGSSSGGKAAGDTARRADPGGAARAADGSGSARGGGAAPGSQATGAPKLTASSIIRTASLTVRVKDVPKALEMARTTAENAGGYVGDETTSRDGEGHEETRVVLRVPSARYDEVLTGLAGTGRLIERTAKAQDVTDQVVDVDSRVKSQRASVARVRALMDKATKLGDVVTLEGELSRREADLEALLAQQASLKDRTSLATITLSLSQNPVTEPASHHEPGFVDALTGGWHVFVAVLRWIVLVLGAVLPFAATAVLLILLWLRVVRPRLPRRAARAGAPAMTALGPLQGAPHVPHPAAEGAGRGGQPTDGPETQD